MNEQSPASYLAIGPYAEALEGITAALRIGEGFVKIVGEPGTGKSALCAQLATRLEAEGFELLVLSRPPADAEEFESLLRRRFTLDDNASLNRALSDYLRESSPPRRLLIIVDEAQESADWFLLAVRLLTNIQDDSKGLVRLVLAGSPALDQRLAEPANRSLLQHLGHTQLLAPLTRGQAAEFCQALMLRGGLERHGLEEKAARLLHRLSRGYPGRLGAMWGDLLGCQEILPPTITARSVRALVKEPEDAPLALEPSTIAISLGGVLLVAVLGFWTVGYLEAVPEPRPVSAPDAPPALVDADTAVPPGVDAEPAGEIEALAPVASETGLAQAEVPANEDAEVLPATPVPVEDAASADARLPAAAEANQGVRELPSAREDASSAPESEEQLVVAEAAPPVAQEESPPEGLAAFVAEWLDSWSRQDVATYLSHYHPEFSSLYHASREDWREDRGERLLAPASISLAYDRFEVVLLEEDRATLRFWMRYESPGYADETWKELRLREEDGRWLILVERNLETNVLRR